MIASHLLLILHKKKYSFISLCLKPEMWQKVAKFKGAEYFRKALYVLHGGIRIVREGLLNPRVQPIDYSITPKMEESGCSGRRLGTGLSAQYKGSILEEEYK